MLQDYMEEEEAGQQGKAWVNADVSAAKKGLQGIFRGVSTPYLLMPNSFIDHVPLAHVTETALHIE